MNMSLLDTILNPSRLSVRFQPIFLVRSESNQVDCLEALVRGPRRTNFERADVLFDYVRRKKAEPMMDRSCTVAICDAALNLPGEIRVNVNVHAATLGHKAGFVEFFESQTQRRGLLTDRFTIEIVEHAPSCDIPELMDGITALRDLGVRIALDDVGLGQSNYRMMLDCHPEYFKLDAYFVRGLNADPKRRAVVDSVATLARALGSAVVAEGVESDQDLAQLRRMGIELVQANILCPAMPLEDLVEKGVVPGASPSSLSVIKSAEGPGPQAFDLKSAELFSRAARQSS
jgi:EAL domain-containing protein (putative c-di-GMP-specific phosphodiesterase class I)